eukprot:5099364-Lingulodinium_polyedra.AAC.1
MIAEHPDTPIAPGSTFQSLFTHMKYRIKAVGGRVKNLTMEDSLPDWSTCGTWTAYYDRELLHAKHAPSNTIVLTLTAIYVYSLGNAL